MPEWTCPVLVDIFHLNASTHFSSPPTGKRTEAHQRGYDRFGLSKQGASQSYKHKQGITVFEAVTGYCLSCSAWTYARMAKNTHHRSVDCADFFQ